MPINLPVSATLQPFGLARVLPLARLLASLPDRWGQRHRQRKALTELDERLLADVGLTPRQAERECRKPPWR